MTEVDVARIEAELGLVLPAHYREFVLAYPQSLHTAKFAYDEEPASASFLFDDPQKVIDHNRRIREPGLLVTDNETGPWPDDYLIIGEDCGGNCWCFKLRGRDKAVWSFDHEDGVFQRQSKSLAKHEQYALKFVEEFNREE
jgi:SMI1 / KNR4 family (SUKH-1)